MTKDLFWPYLTAHLPGIGGQMKMEPEDFVVEEIPAYEPAGSGDHTFLTIEKRNRNTLDVIRELALFLEVSERDIGFAGLKDRQSIARQRLSVPGIPPEKIQGLAFEGFRVVAAERHPHKLRRGHLRGNRFRIRLRQVHPETAIRLPPILKYLAQQGVPNGYGPQRFGIQRMNHIAGRALLLQDRTTLKKLHLPKRLSRRHRSLYLSAYQSYLFNRYLARRIQTGTFDTVIAGDLAQKHTTGGLFVVEDPAVEAPRAAAREISATGPIFGYRMREPAQEAAQLEQKLLDTEDLTLESFRPARLKGTRRILRWFPEELAWQLEGQDLILQFTAPDGAYATAFLREIQKNETPADAEDGMA